MKLSIQALLVTDYILKHCCQCKVRIHEIPSGLTGIKYGDKMVSNTLVETSVRSEWLMSVCAVSLPAHTQGCQS